MEANIFEVDLLNAIKGDARLGDDIQRLLAELNKQRISDTLVQYLFKFEAYFDQVCKDIDLKLTNNSQLQKVKDTMEVAWDASSVSEQEVEKLEAKLQEYKDNKTLLDNQIAHCQAKILELNKEIDNLEKQKVELAWEK